jgi:hypothetical protein
VRRVKGIDLSPQEIVEARKRFQELLQQQPGDRCSAAVASDHLQVHVQRYSQMPLASVKNNAVIPLPEAWCRHPAASGICGIA